MFSKGPNFRKLNTDSDMDPNILKTIINKEFIVFILKFTISLTAIIFGGFLISVGITSESIIEFSFKGAEIKLNNALPGITMSIFGVLLMLFSRLNIRIKK
jgi:hypothetical protein